MTALIKLYVNLVLNNRKTIAQIPSLLRLAVETEIEKLKK